MTDEPAEKPPKYNINTWINLTTLVSIIAGGGYAWAQTNSDIDELKRWRVAVEGRLGNADGKIEERFKVNEVELRKLDNLSYRVTVAEQSATSISQAIKELQITASGQSGDLRVMREILQRIEAAQKQR
ncbi:MULTISPECIES: hypothetical protein [Rhizobium/Agrobacterium group]|uniref:hypothetical protein n=1 Tax=Rhizobium/Agrobacterium group TaxID=227290 RepID=UPI000B3F65A4|nr:MULTISPECIES: hypothetical protein [Rhizobium/Agrobacterium group]MCF1481647.1 hypothetical protein [Allorhizobium ampelinum]NSZ42582.1 hypothetical protein [Agrobacterium vitis]NTA26290.1 hypothetical protein [Allorhizobium ampelinum]OVE95592.1 hypothetical protein B7W85_07225 [Allorhizobium ampelinum]